MDIDEILERHNKAFNLQNVILKANAKQAIKEIVKETLRMAADDAGICIVQDKKHGEIIVIGSTGVLKTQRKLTQIIQHFIFSALNIVTV